MFVCLFIVILVVVIFNVSFLSQLRHFLLQQLGPVASQKALEQVREVIGEVLQAAVSTDEKQPSVSR